MVRVPITGVNLFQIHHPVKNCLWNIVKPVVASLFRHMPFHALHVGKASLWDLLSRFHECPQ